MTFSRSCFRKRRICSPIGHKLALVLDSIGAEQTANHCLNWWQASSVTQKCILCLCCSRGIHTKRSRWFPSIQHPGLYSLSDKTFYRQISWSLEEARFDVLMVVSLWNLTGTPVAGKTVSKCGGFEASQDVAVRRPSALWIEYQKHILCLCRSHGIHTKRS